MLWRKLRSKLAVMLALCCIFGANFWVAQTQTVLASAEIEQGVALPIIMYHSILKDDAQANDYVLSPTVLAQDLDYLQQHGYQTVTMNEVIAYVNGQGDLPEKPVMITFDDGFYNNYLYAAPLLAERDMTAVISVLGSTLEQYTQTGEINAYWSYLTADMLTEMVASGTFEVQNHSYDMHDTEPRQGCLQQTGESVQTYQEIFIADTLQAQQMFATYDFAVPTCYTYPLGAYSAQTEQILKQLGFQATLCCTEGINYITTQPDCLYLLKRYNRPSGIGTEKFMENCGVM